MRTVLAALLLACAVLPVSAAVPAGPNDRASITYRVVLVPRSTANYPRVIVIYRIARDNREAEGLDTSKDVSAEAIEIARANARAQAEKELEAMQSLVKP